VVSVVVADPNVLVRNLLRVVCAQHRIGLLAEVSSVAELVTACRDHAPDVAVSALEFDDGLLEAHLEELRATGARVVALTADPSPDRLTSALVRGASGYLLHDSAPEQVAEAIHAVAGGQVALHPAAASTIVQQWRRLRTDAPNGKSRGALTEREREVLAAMTDGLSAKGIARRLGVVVKTVENHKIHIFDKLGVRTQAQAVSVALTQGLLTMAADREYCTEETE
jgi:DNA-binding NarL/FixJ family response regulator